MSDTAPQVLVGRGKASQAPQPKAPTTDLEQRDRTIRLLQYLFTITMSSVREGEVSQRIVDAISRELGFELVLLFSVDSDRHEIAPTAINRVNGIEMPDGESLFSDVVIPMSFEGNSILKALKDREKRFTDALIDVVSPSSARQMTSLSERLGIASYVLYPLSLHDKMLGALVVGSTSAKDKLQATDLDELETLVTVIGVALERAKLHEDLHVANDKLKELDHLKDEFVMLASHELRTPMTAIKGSLSTILEGYAGPIDPKAREFLAAAYNENERLMRIVNNLLTISKMQAGRFTFSIVKIDIQKIIDEVVTNMQMAAKEKNLYLKYDKPEHIPAVYADPDKVKEVLVNLIGNAIKFTHRGGVTIRVVEHNSDVVVSITDTGSGIKPEEKDLLFQKYSQLQNNYSQQTGGTGLGLYICKQNIKGMNGKIWLETNLGIGSTFFFSLPVAP